MNGKVMENARQFEVNLYHFALNDHVRLGITRGDQKRTVDVSQAFANGADYIVVGRPIRSASDPRAAALAIQQTISTVFTS